MYAIDRLEELANQRDFAASVRAFAHDVIGAGMATSSDLRHLAPLTQYGPRTAGSLLRLHTVPSFATLDGDLARRWSELCEQLETARD